MYKDIKEISYRKRTIFIIVLIFHACGLLFIVHVNGWFQQKKPFVQEKKTELRDKEVRNDEKIRDVKEKNKIKDKNLKIKNIYLPKQDVFVRQVGKRSENVNKQTKSSVEKELNLVSKEQSLPEKVKKTEDIASVKTVKSTEEKQNNIAHKKVPEFTSKKVSLPEKTVKQFNFTEYKKNLIENYELREGEKIPLLLIDDHNKSELYKTGLEFYGYQLIARPRVRPKEPYYLIINDLRSSRIDATCPYTGIFPSALREDYKLFKRLLSQPEFIDVSNVEYQLFYAPLDTMMLNILECKQKFIIENAHLIISEISKMIGTFRRFGNSYILIIESIVTANGNRIKVYDPDNRIMNVG